MTGEVTYWQASLPALISLMQIRELPLVILEIIIDVTFTCLVGTNLLKIGRFSTISSQKAIIVTLSSP